MLSPSTILRLETQPDVIPSLLSGATPAAIMARPASGQWSAHENLAHLARHQTVFLGRLRRILGERAPQLGRYRAEEDSAWPEWSGLSTAEVLSRHQAGRAEFIRLGKGLSPADVGRVGIHPLLWDMSLALWVEFFLLHEAHHLYVVMTRLGQVKRSLGLPPSP
jgi:DinB family protein